MVLLEDTRNKVGEHKNIQAYCEHNGILLRRSKLYVGDYQIADNAKVAVDTKQDVIELAGNIFQSHERFRRECLRAQEAEIQLIILIEEELPQGGLVNWKSPTYRSTTRYHRYGDPISRINPSTLKKAMLSMTDKYGVQFRFCDWRSTGRLLIKYLQEGIK